MCLCYSRKDDLVCVACLLLPYLVLVCLLCAACWARSLPIIQIAHSPCFQINSAIVPTKALSDPMELERTLQSGLIQTAAAAAAAAGAAAGQQPGGGFDPAVSVAANGEVFPSAAAAAAAAVAAANPGEVSLQVCRERFSSIIHVL